MELLKYTDTFSDWREKINSLIGEFVLSESSFAYSESLSAGLNVHIQGGQVRDNTLVVQIPEETIALPASNIVTLVLEKSVDQEGFHFAVYDIDGIPSRGCIPLWIFETGPGNIIGAMDLRTQFVLTIDSDDVGPIMMFDKIIVKDTVIPPTKNALSVSPTVEDGVTVTVEEDSTWVIL